MQCGPRNVRIGQSIDFLYLIFLLTADPLRIVCLTVFVQQGLGEAFTYPPAIYHSSQLWLQLTTLFGMLRPIKVRYNLHR